MHYDVLLSSGKNTFRNYLMFRTPPLAKAFGWWWTRPHRDSEIEGINLADSRAVKQTVSVPVVVTGGFQTASVIAAAIERGDCDGVTIARPLVANPDLVRHFERLDRAPKPCTYCNKCLFSFIEHPLACYEPARFDSHEEMIREALSVYDGAGTTERRGDLPAAEVPQPRDQEPDPPLEHLAASTTTTVPARRRGSTGRFARGGVGAILSAWTAVDERKIVPSFAGIESDERVPFWRELGERVHEHDCKYVLQLAHAGRQRDIPTLTHGKGLSSTNKPDPLHGFEASARPGPTSRRSSALSRRARAARAKPGSTASRSTARTATSSRSSSPRPSTSARTSTAGRSRTARGCSSTP